MGFLPDGTVGVLNVFSGVDRGVVVTKVEFGERVEITGEGFSVVKLFGLVQGETDDSNL